MKNLIVLTCSCVFAAIMLMAMAVHSMAQVPGRSYSIYGKDNVYSGYYRVDRYNGSIHVYNRYNGHTTRLTPNRSNNSYSVYDNYNRYSGRFEVPKQTISAQQYRDYKAQLKADYNARHNK